MMGSIGELEVDERPGLQADASITEQGCEAGTGVQDDPEVQNVIGSRHGADRTRRRLRPVDLPLHNLGIRVTKPQLFARRRTVRQPRGGRRKSHPPQPTVPADATHRRQRTSSGRNSTSIQCRLRQASSSRSGAMGCRRSSGTGPRHQGGWRTPSGPTLGAAGGHPSDVVERAGLLGWSRVEIRPWANPPEPVRVRRRQKSVGPAQPGERTSGWHAGAAIERLMRGAEGLARSQTSARPSSSPRTPTTVSNVRADLVERRFLLRPVSVLDRYDH